MKPRFRELYSPAFPELLALFYRRNRDYCSRRGVHAVADRCAPKHLGVESMSHASSSKREDRGQLKLGAFMYPAGHHVAAWRHPDVSAFATTDFAYRAA